MHRFFVTDIHDDWVVFSAEQAQQISAVLRMAPGQRVIVLDNAGSEYEAELAAVEKKRVTAVILSKRPAPNEPACQLTLYQSLLKRDNFEWILQKGTELGVARFVPLITDRTVARVPKKADRWQRILIEAAEQSQRGRIPELAEPIRLPQALTELPANQTALIPWEGPWDEVNKTSIRDAGLGDETAVALFIGPEGGFTTTEIEQARQAGVLPVTMGRRILRAETAAIAAAVLVLDELGEMA